MDKMALLDINGNVSAEISAEIAKNETEIKRLTERQKEIKDGLLNAMRDAGIVKAENDFIKVTYVAPTTQEGIDSKALKTDLPQIYNTYCKISNKKDYVKIEVK